MADGTDPSPRPRRAFSPNVVALGVLVALGAALLLWQRPWSGDAGTSVDTEFPRDAARLLDTQFDALTAAATRDEFIAAAGDGAGAQELAAAIWSSREVLDVTDARLRYVRGATGPDAADGSALALVQVDWSLGDESPLGAAPRERSLVGFRVQPSGDGFDVVSARVVEGRLPLWLAGDVELAGTPAARLVRVDGAGGAAMVERVETAHAAVSRLLPDAPGDLVVVAPATSEQAAGLLGQSVASLDQIAAVATPLGEGARSPRVVLLNPDVFDRQDARAAQVVMTHEAVHLMTDAIGSGAESWVLEGFADFVALHDDDAPLAISAGQALELVRENGPPQNLPEPGDFANSTHGLGALYESTWLAFRMLGESRGDARVIAFYDRVLGGSTAAEAAVAELGLTIDQLTADWRAYLTKSASMVS